MSDSDSDVPLGQRASQTAKPGGGAEPASPDEALAAPKPADESDSDDEPIGAKFAAKVAPGAATTGMTLCVAKHNLPPPPLPRQTECNHTNLLPALYAASFSVP